MNQPVISSLRCINSYSKLSAINDNLHFRYCFSIEISSFNPTLILSWPWNCHRQNGLALFHLLRLEYLIDDWVKECEKELERGSLNEWVSEWVITKKKIDTLSWSALVNKTKCSHRFRFLAKFDIGTSSMVMVKSIYMKWNNDRDRPKSKLEFLGHNKINRNV